MQSPALWIAISSGRRRYYNPPFSISEFDMIARIATHEVGLLKGRYSPTDFL
jgi:hypothetical protein